METIKITEEELRHKLEDLSEAGEKALETYFEFDPKTRQYKLKDHIELVDASSKGLDTVIKGFVLDSLVPLANNWSRRRRFRRYRKSKLAFPDRLRVVSEGDSWFQHPQPGMRDVIDQLSDDFSIYSLGAAMDELTNIFRQKEYLQAIREEQPHLFLLSGGGNDILGEQFLGFLLDEFEPGDPGLNARRFLAPSFFRQMENLRDMYEQIACEIRDNFPGLPMVVHGYDYLIPNNPEAKLSWSWLGVFMDKKRITDLLDKKAIINFLIDRFSDQLVDLARRHDHVYYVDARGRVAANQWNDEIHPTSDGFKVVADEFRKVIRGLPVGN